MTPDSGAPGTEDLDTAALAVVARLRNRFRGALLGLALGEALAAPAQLLKRGSFTPVRDLLGGGPFDLPPGVWTDDTALALHVARSLLECGCCDVADQLARFQRWQRTGEGSPVGECLGISASVSRALVDGTAGSSFADGADSLVRTIPLALWHFADAEGLRRDTAAVVAVTSHESATRMVAIEFAMLLLSALRGGSRIDAPTDASPACAAARLLDEVRTAVNGATSWKEAVLRAVNEGGDADVRAAAAGALAGAIFGVDSIPAGWLAALAERAAIEDIADALLAETLVRLEAEG